MRLTLALGSLALVGAAVAIAACAGFSSEEASVESADASGDMPPDSQTIADSGPRRFGKATLLRDRQLADTFASYNPEKSAMYLSAGAYYNGFMTLAAPPDGGAKFLLAPVLDGGDGGFEQLYGFFPSVARNGNGTAIMLYQAPYPELDGGADARAYDAVIWRGVEESTGRTTPPVPVVFGEQPFVLPNLLGLYFMRDATFRRATLGDFYLPTGEIAVEVTARSGSAILSPSHPLVTADETTLYFAALDVQTANAHIWVASRTSAHAATIDGGVITFGDAHPLEFSDSDLQRPEVPTWLSADGTELVFVRSGLRPAGEADAEAGASLQAAIYAIHLE